MSMRENEPRPNSEPQNIGVAFERLAETVCTRVFDPFERFMLAPLSLAQSYRERHPKIATAVTVGVFVPPVLIGVGYGWANNELLYGLSAGSDAWIVECAIAKLISRFRPTGVSL